MSFVVTLRSRDRVSGDANSFLCTLPPLPKGQYRACFSLVANQASVTELCVRWGGMQQVYSTKQSQSFATVMAFDVYAESGILFIQDAQQQVEVQYVDAATGAVRTDMTETTIVVEFQAIA